jgi:hypothetical protein
MDDLRQDLKHALRSRPPGPASKLLRRARPAMRCRAVDVERPK